MIEPVIFSDKLTQLAAPVIAALPDSGLSEREQVKIEHLLEKHSRAVDTALNAGGSTLNSADPLQEYLTHVDGLTSLITALQEKDFSRADNARQAIANFGEDAGDQLKAMQPRMNMIEALIDNYQATGIDSSALKSEYHILQEMQATLLEVQQATQQFAQSQENNSQLSSRLNASAASETTSTAPASEQRSESSGDGSAANQESGQSLGLSLPQQELTQQAEQLRGVNDERLQAFRQLFVQHQISLGRSLEQAEQSFAQEKYALANNPNPAAEIERKTGEIKSQQNARESEMAADMHKHTVFKGLSMAGLKEALEAGRNLVAALDKPIVDYASLTANVSAGLSEDAKGKTPTPVDQGFSRSVP